MDLTPQRQPGAVTVRPIGQVVSPRGELTDDHWGEVPAVIRLDGTVYGEEALLGLADFSHLEVVFHFHRVPEDDIETGARHPRVGIFAQRNKDRPNRLGVSRCTLVKVDGMELHVLGLDAVDGSPVLDIKPYLREFGPRGELRQPQWSAELLSEYY
ncbi:SAM-dependent methyltransferase [Streptomyces decoyicus]|uniref:SAM-dependent methyltransferase n=1 Tax=Streptomyces decoyicus TaxID=249567 RepID=UPI0033D1E51B